MDSICSAVAQNSFSTALDVALDCGANMTMSVVGPAVCNMSSSAAYSVSGTFSLPVTPIFTNAKPYSDLNLNITFKASDGSLVHYQLPAQYLRIKSPNEDTATWRFPQDENPATNATSIALPPVGFQDTNTTNYLQVEQIVGHYALITRSGLATTGYTFTCAPSPEYVVGTTIVQ